MVNEDDLKTPQNKRKRESESEAVVENKHTEQKELEYLQHLLLQKGKEFNEILGKLVKKEVKLTEEKVLRKRLEEEKIMLYQFLNKKGKPQGRSIRPLLILYERSVRLTNRSLNTYNLNDEPLK